MKKGFGLGWFLLGAALLTPYAAEKNEETGEYEIRSLLLKVKTKKNDGRRGQHPFGLLRQPCGNSHKRRYRDDTREYFVRNLKDFGRNIVVRKEGLGRFQRRPCGEL